MTNTAYESTRALFNDRDNASTEQTITTGILELLVDRFGLAVTASALADVAGLKSAHAQEAWGDKALARKWSIAEHKLNDTALHAALEVR